MDNSRSFISLPEKSLHSMQPLGFKESRNGTGIEKSMPNLEKYSRTNNTVDHHQ
jgi:hypothetical protein